MKKVLSILLSMSLLLGLAACSKEAGSESGETTEENAGLSLQDYDINSMSIDEVMDLLISVVDIPEGCHSWEEEEPRVRAEHCRAVFRHRKAVGVVPDRFLLGIIEDHYGIAPVRYMDEVES